jgi:hypothetical protein
MEQMREIIKMSEENIKRAGLLLQKYQRSDEIEPEVSKRQSTIQSDEPKSDEKTANVLKDEQANEINQTRRTDLAATKKETVESSVQTAEDKNIQTAGNLNWKSRQYFGNVYDHFSNFNHIKFNQPPLAHARHNPFSSPLNPCECFGCEKRRSFQQVSSYQSILDSGKSSPHRSPFKVAPTTSKLPAAYNPIYSDDDEVMKAANKFLRSVEKQKSRNSESEVSSNQSSKSFTPQKLFSDKSSSSVSTPSSPLSNVKQSAFDSHVPRAQLDLENIGNNQKIQRNLEDTKAPTEEGNPTRSSSDSPQLSLSDLQLNQEFLERYLSEGEVLSQGEIQLGLSDDDDVPDDF